LKFFYQPKFNTMPFLEILYGSQFEEIKKMGKDGNKGRLNANIFLSVMLMMVLGIIFLGLKILSGQFSQELSGFYDSYLDGFSGRSLGKIIAIPFMAISYLIVSKTVGTEAKFKIYTENYMQYPEDVKKQSNKKLLVPFFVLFACIILLGFMA